jgi:hypothetical protein
MVNVIIDIFEISYEEYVPYFKHLENTEKIRPTTGSGLVAPSVYDSKRFSVTEICYK